MSYFEIGILNSKTPINIGTLWRSAYQLGASGIFTINNRWSSFNRGADTYKSYKHIPLRHYDTFDEFHRSIPYDCKLIAVEMNGTNLKDFKHPERAVYILGAEDYGLPDDVIDKCDGHVSLCSDRQNSYNVSVAGSIIGYHRVFL
jgi:tRNA G18 (ribose-2'-O)-methylase SpoU